MRKFLFFVILLIPFSLFSQNAIFLHHSTGGGVWGGGVPAWITNYNNANSTSYQATEMSYPNTPYPWENYPYDFWYLWCNNQCNSAVANIECLNTLTAKYKLIIIKHCFPGAGVGPDGTPNVASSSKTLVNYKLQYRALRAKFDSFPSNKFMVWTLAPLHRLATNAADAARAKQFVDWVKTDWLTEDGKSHPNIYIFDFFGYAAELNPSPANGLVNCLKYDYEGSHSGSDSHPNTLANTTIAPFFGQAIVDALKDTSTASYTVNFIVKEGATALSGVSVTFNSQTLSTDGTGKVVFNNVNKGNLLSYAASKTGYTTQNSSADISKDTTINISLVKITPGTFTVTFVVKEGTANLQGAKATFNSTNINTDAAGRAVFSGVAPGNSKSYSITKTGYVTKSGTVNVSKDTTINIGLVKTVSLSSERGLDLKIYPNPFNESIQITANADLNKIQLVSVTGVIIKEWTSTNTASILLNLSDVQAGYYLLSVLLSDNSSKITAVIKQ